MKKKRFKFKVKLCIVELNSVTLVSGMLFTKIRLEDSSKFTDYTNRVEVRDHCVSWLKDVEFDVGMTAHHQTGILDKCMCRLSVRKELKGGKTFQKLGYVDLNMASYAGQGHITRSFILQGYNEKHRLDNSILRIGIHLTLTSGDPLFKTPHSPSSNGYPIDSDNVCSGDLTEANKGEMPAELSDTTERKGGYGSLVQIPDTVPETASLTRHTRSPSNSSRQSSKLVMATTSGHNRTQSLDCPSSHVRSLSSGSTPAFLSLRKPVSNDRDQRIDSTRVDTSSVVDELFGGMSLDDTQQEAGLQLYIGEDGSASVTGHTNGGHTVYKPVPMPPS